MKQAEWCEIAQRDQNDDKVSHLYANFRHSVSQKLISDEAKAAFADSINAIVDIAQFEDDPSGPSNGIVRAATEIQYRSGALPTVDFRYGGPPIGVVADQIFASVAVRFEASTASGVGRSRSKSYVPTPDKVAWVSDPNSFLRHVKVLFETKGARLTLEEFFSDAAAHLGLKRDQREFSNIGNYSCNVNIYRLRPSQPVPSRNLHRPNAWSGGYADRFCGASALRPWGATIDNRHGRAGFPEAITPRVNLQPVAPREFNALFRGRLSRYVDITKSPAEEISALLSGDVLWDSQGAGGKLVKEGLQNGKDIRALLNEMEKLDYGKVRTTVLHRLSSSQKACTACVASGNPSDPCLC
jgi:hypothetical protein